MLSHPGNLRRRPKPAECQGPARIPQGPVVKYGSTFARLRATAWAGGGAGSRKRFRTRLLPQVSPTCASKLTMACSSDSSAAKGRPGTTFAVHTHRRKQCATGDGNNGFGWPEEAPPLLGLAGSSQKTRALPEPPAEMIQCYETWGGWHQSNPLLAANLGRG